MNLARCPKSGKIMFPTEADARKQAKKLKKQDKSKRNVYSCGDHWHFGHDKYLKRVLRMKSARMNPKV